MSIVRDGKVKEYEFATFELEHMWLIAIAEVAAIYIATNNNNN